MKRTPYDRAVAALTKALASAANPGTPAGDASIARALANAASTVKRSGTRAAWISVAEEWAASGTPAGPVLLAFVTWLKTGEPDSFGR